jgi:hypothetical protein
MPSSQKDNILNLGVDVGDSDVIAIDSPKRRWPGRTGRRVEWHVDLSNSFVS